MTLVFDCETTGLLKDPKSRPIQLGWVLLDMEGREHTSKEYLLKTVTEVPLESTKVHGITTETLLKNGVSPKDPLQEFLDVTKEVIQGGGCIVAHNSAFDVEMLRRACVDRSVEYTLGVKDVFCTMSQSTLQCKLEPFRYGTFKWPRLTELADILGIKYDSSTLHGALADTRLTAQAYLAGRKSGWWV